MECRICLEETPPFLTNVCACRGTQQYIHEFCLKRWIAMRPSMKCDVCKETLTIPLKPMRMPFFPWLYDESTRWILNVLLMGFCLFPTYAQMLAYQQFLHLLHSISYLSLLPTFYERPRYILQWFKPVLVLPQQVIYPLPSLFMYILVARIPFFGTVVCLQNIRWIHVGIVNYMENVENR